MGKYEVAANAGFYLSLVPEVIGELIADSMNWLGERIDDAMDVWGEE